MKIDICFITSTPHLESHAALSNRHMALAHLVLQDEEYAKSNKHGMWSMEFEYPWDFRSNN